MAPDDAWAAGALDTRRAAEFLSVSVPYFRAVARREGWVPKYEGAKALYPRALLAAYLLALPTEPGPKLRAKVARMRADQGA